MKAVTAFFVVFALVMFIVSPGFAAKGNTTEQPQTLVRENIPNPQEAPQGEAAPGSVRNYTTEALLPIPPGTYTVGAAGLYPSIAAAVTALQANGITGGGDVVFQLIDPLYNDTSQTIGGYPGQSATNLVIFRPAPATVVTIKFSPVSTARQWGFRLDQAAGVVFDGSNSGGSDRSLTILCDTVTTANMNAFLIQRGSETITLKNMIIKGNRRAASGGNDVVRITNVTTPAATLPQHDITVNNCAISRGIGGIYSSGLGALTVAYDYNMVFTNNFLGGGASADVTEMLCGTAGGSGLLLGYVSNAVVDRNEFYGLKAGGTAIPIRLNAAVGYARITNNKVHGVELYAGSAARPMFFLMGNNPVAGAPIRSRALVANNMFYDMHNYGIGTGGRGFEGVFYNATTGTIGQGSAVEYINNTFAWTIGAGEGGPVGTPGTCFIFDGNFAGGGTGFSDSVVIRYNIAATSRPDGFTRSFLIFTESAPGLLQWYGDRNLFNQIDGGGFVQMPVPWPTGGAAVLPGLADWQTNSGNDLNSKQGNPFFLSATDPHISQVLGDVSGADSLALPYAGITTDIDGQVRNAVKPDAGADEFTATRFVNDLAAKSFDYPPPTLILKAGGAFSAKATFANPGSATHGAAPVVCQILSGATVVYTGTASIAIGGYDNTAQATFAPPASIPAGSYTVRAIAALPGDSRAANDTVVSSLFVQASINTLPYSIGFESGAPGWITNAASGSPNDWIVGTPAKTQILGANGGTNCWVTKTTGVYSSPQESFINLPILDLTTFSGTLLVQFYNNFQTEDTWDGGELQVSVDGGLGWTKVDSTVGTPPAYNTPTSTAWYNQDTAWIGDPNYGWSGSSAGYAGDVNGWVRSSTAIAGLSGLPDVRLRWAFRADDNTAFDGWAIDDVLIKKLDQNDISLATLGIPGYVGGPVPELVPVTEPNAKSRTNNERARRESSPSLGAFTTAAPITFDAEVRNSGVLPQPAFTVGWELDAAPQAPVANTDPLPFGGSQILPLTWGVPTTGFHNVRAYTQLATDLNTSNDSASFNFEVLAPEVVFYEGFNGPVFPPPGWDTVNNDGNTGPLRNWYQSAGYPYDGAFGARGNFNSAVDPGNPSLIDDWLITPMVAAPPLETTYYVDSLTFQLTGQSATYADSLMILVSTTTDDISAFTIQLDYVLADPVDYRRLAYALPTGYKYIAFRYLLYLGGPSGSSSDNIYLDDVRVTRHTFANAFLATPNNVNFGILSIGFTSVQTVQVTNPGNLPLTISTVTSSDNTNFSVTATTGLVPPGGRTVFVSFQPTTIGVKSDTIVFVHDADSTPDTVIATGQGAAAIMFTSLPPDSVLLENPLKPFNSTKPVKRFKGFYPNWSNLLDEMVAQGAFQPGTSESDSAGGARIGVSFMYLKAPLKWAVNKAFVTQYHWMRLSKWDFKKSVGKSFNALQKTLIDKTGRHTLAPRGLDFTTDGKNRPLKGQYTKLTPKKHSNKLLAEMVALKVNIAASALGKTPAGFGELVFNRPGHPFHGRTVKQISADVDTGLTYYVNPLYVQAYYDSALLAVSLINRSFVGPLDTVSWEAGGKGVAQLVVKGAVNLAGAPFLSLPPGPFVVTRVTPANNLTESPEDFEDEEFEDAEGMPVAAKLYQNYPNPFNPSTTIAFRLREESKVSIRIFNLLGQQVASLIDGEELEEGVQEIQFAATNLASGIYFYQIDAQGLGDDAMKTIETRKMLLVK